MRSFPCALALALLLVPASVRADDGAGSAEKPDPKVPLYSIEFLMPRADDAPEGWKVGGKAPADSPGESALYELAQACGLDDETFYVETGTLSQGTEAVGFAMVDVDKKVWALRARLDARVAEAGWLQRELGSPTRLLVVGSAGGLGPRALDALTEHVIYRMAELAMDRIRGRSGTEEAGRDAAVAYAEGVRAIAPQAGVAQAVLGIVQWLESRPKKKDEQPNRVVEDRALDFFTKALADGVRYPPKGSVRVFVAGQLGGILLARKDKAVLEKATRALEIAVEHEQDGKDNGRRFGHRYDLACAYARAGRVDQALDMLAKAVETGKTLPPAEWRGYYEHMKEKDPDMGPLRGDERFAKLMKDNEPPPDPRKNPHGNDPHGGNPPANPHGGNPPENPHGGNPPKDPHPKGD